MQSTLGTLTLLVNRTGGNRAAGTAGQFLNEAFAGIENRDCKSTVGSLQSRLNGLGEAFTLGAVSDDDAIDYDLDVVPLILV